MAMQVDATIIVGILTLVGTIITVWAGNVSTKDKILAELNKHNAVQDERLTELTREVRRHNDFAERIPKLESRYENLEKRVDRLEKSN